MAKCPNCGKEIDHLHVNVTEEYVKSYAGGNGDYDEIDQIGTEMRYWRCPECEGEIPLADQDVADAFLAGRSGKVGDHYVAN